MNPQDRQNQSPEASENQQPRSVEPETTNDIAGTEPSRTKAERPKDEIYWEKRQFRVQRMIAYAGVLGIAIYALQLCEMRKSTDAATKAANASEASVKIAEDSMKRAIESEQLDRRAWITTHIVKFEKTLALGEQALVYVECLNSGRTIAFDVRLTAAVLISPELSLEELEANEKVVREDRPDIKEVSRTPIAPNGAKHVVANSKAFLSQDDLNGFNDGTLNLYVLGIIRYRDASGISRVTTFCNWTNGQAADKGNLMACPRGNTVD